MKKSCVLVSGGAGYIGSHTAVELISAGYDVVIVDNLSNSDIDAVEGVRRITGVDVPFEKADCCDRDAFARVFEKYDFDSVIHFAASKAVGESVSKPLEYYRNNLMSFMNVIGLMREYGRQNIVFSSSCTVYGEADVLPVTEQTPRKPATSPYGNTKQMCEDIPPWPSGSEFPFSYRRSSWPHPESGSDCPPEWPGQSSEAVSGPEKYCWSPH